MKVGLASQGTERAKGQHCYRAGGMAEAEAPKGVGSEALADHVHVIDAGPGVAAAVRNETKILNLFLVSESPLNNKKGRKSGAKRPWSSSTHEGKIYPL